MHPSSHDSTRFSGAKLALLCGEHLLTYRRDDKPGIPFPGFWDLPGGGREGEESPVECALRELDEEFAITLPPARITWLKSHPPLSQAGPPGYFLAAHVTVTELARIRFGSEGERWKLMRIADFLSRPDVPSQLQARLAEYLKQRPLRPGDVATSLDVPRLRVSALFRDRLSSDVNAFRPTHVISLLDPTWPAERRPRLPAGVRVSQHHFFDGDSPPELPPNEAVIREIVAFLADWLDCHRGSDEARLLIHCHMGVSRSTAVAMVALALAFGPGREGDAFAHGLTLMNKPWPNSNVIRIADQQLGRDGALLEQLMAYRARYPRRPMAYGRLHRKRGVLLDWSQSHRNRGR